MEGLKFYIATHIDKLERSGSMEDRIRISNSFVRFVLIDGKFIPLMKEDMDKKIEDFIHIAQVEF